MTTPLDDNIIAAEDLWKIYQLGKQEVNALCGVSFVVKRNDLMAIMGPSGSGKSTLMNLIGCLDTPTKGKYHLNGKLVSEMSENELAFIRNQEIGFVFQVFNLLPRATTFHNVELPLIYKGASKKERLEKTLKEPTGNLDTKTGNEILNLFHKIHSQGNTIITVTHDPDIAQQAQRIIYIRDGKIEREERRGEHDDIF
jgi:putative ABC transport system ATP-binding protein